MKRNPHDDIGIPKGWKMARSMKEAIATKDVLVRFPERWLEGTILTKNMSTVKATRCLVEIDDVFLTGRVFRITVESPRAMLVRYKGGNRGKKLTRG